MKVFELPDLGEGLPDAEIREWYVKPGDKVTLDQPLAAMETAKALVDVPAPYDGCVEKLFGEPGDRINTGDPLIGFTGESDAQSDAAPQATTETAAPTAASSAAPGTAVKAPPAVRALAKKLGVDLSTLQGTGPNSLITADDVNNATGTNSNTPATQVAWSELAPVRKAMSMAMSKSHAEVVPVTLSDDADISAWNQDQNFTMRFIRAIEAACHAEPMLNSHFNPSNYHYRSFDAVNLGIAVDTPHGLYVPVLKDTASQSADDLRSHINRLKQLAMDKSISADEQKDATIILSNFGAFAGKYANPIVTPPMTAIVGVGRCYEQVVLEGENAVAHRFAPISVSVDHRAVTGGEVARFMRAMIDALEKEE